MNESENLNSVTPFKKRDSKNNESEMVPLKTPDSFGLGSYMSPDGLENMRDIAHYNNQIGELVGDLKIKSKELRTNFQSAFEKYGEKKVIEATSDAIVEGIVGSRLNKFKEELLNTTSHIEGHYEKIRARNSKGPTKTMLDKSEGSIKNSGSTNPEGEEIMHGKKLELFNELGLGLKPTVDIKESKFVKDPYDVSMQGYFKLENVLAYCWFTKTLAVRHNHISLNANDPDWIYIYSLNDSKLKLKTQLMFQDCGSPTHVSFSEEGSRLAVVTTQCINIFDANEGEFSNERKMSYKVDSNQGQWRFLWGYFDIGISDPELYKFSCSEPKRYSFAIQVRNASAKLFRIELPLHKDESAKDVQSRQGNANSNTEEGQMIFLGKANFTCGEFKLNQLYDFTFFRYNYVSNTAWYMSWEGSKITMYSWHVKIVENESGTTSVMVTHAVKNKTHVESQAYKLQMMAIEDCGVAVVSSPVETISLFTFHERCEVKQIIWLPEKIKKITYMQSQDNFRLILAVLNEGALCIWAKLNNGEYGVIYHSSQRSSKAHFWLAPSARFLMKVEQGKCNIHTLITGRKNIYSYCRFPESEVTRDSSKVIHSHSLTANWVFNLGSDFVSLFDISTNRVAELCNEAKAGEDGGTEKYFSFTSILEVKSWTDEAGLMTDFENQKFRGKKRAFTLLAFCQEESNEIHVRVYLIFSNSKGQYDLYLRHSIVIGESVPEKYEYFRGHLILWNADNVTIHQISSNKQKLPEPTVLPLNKQKLRDDQTEMREIVCLQEDCYLVRWINSELNIKDSEVEGFLSTLKVADQSSKADQVVQPLLAPLVSAPPVKPNKITSKTDSSSPVDFSGLATYGEGPDRPEDDIISIDDVDDEDPEAVEKIEEKRADEEEQKEKTELFKTKAQVFQLRLPEKGEKECYLQLMNQLVVNNDLEFLKVSKKGKYWMFFGDHGYDLYTMSTETINHIKSVNTSGVSSIPVFNFLRRRHQKEYYLPYSPFVEFSPDEKLVAFYFTEMSKLMLYNLESITNDDPKLVDKRVFLRSKANFDDMSVIFKFYVPEKVDNPEYSSTLLAVCDQNLKTDKNEVMLYNVNFDYFVVSASFFKHLKVDHLTIVDNPNTRRDGLKILLHHIDGNNISEGVFMVEKNIDKEYSDSKMPYASILRKCLYDYFSQEEDVAVSSQASPADVLDNVFKLISHKYFFADERLAYMMFILNRPGLLEEVYRGPIDTGFFFSQNRALELLFSHQEDSKQHSSTSIIKMMDGYIEQSKFPEIQEEYMLTFIKQRFDPSTFTPARRSMMTHILFAPCHVMITGLITNRYKAIARLRYADARKERIDDEIVQRNIKNIMNKKPKQVNDYVVFRSRIRLDLTNGSEFSLNLVYAMLLMPDDEIRFKYRQLINYKWGLVFWYSFVYVTLFQLLNILVFIYFAYFTQPVIGIFIIVLNSLFISFDIVCFSTSLKLSAKDPMNWLDVIIHGFSIFSVMILLLDRFSGIHAYFRLAALLLISLRGIMHLKMFGPLRILVMLIGKILVDLAWVPFILVAVLILAASIYKVTPLPGGNVNQDITFIEALRTVFMIMFFNAGAAASDSQLVDTSNPSAMLRSIIIVLGATFIAQGILNFIIAVFIQTFKKVQDSQDVYELRSLLLDIKDFDLFLKPFNRFFRKRNHYYLIPVPIPKDGVVYENETMFDKAQSTWNTLVSEAAKKGLDKIKEQAKATFKGKDKQIDMLTEVVKSQSKANDATAKSLINAAKCLKEGGSIPVNDLMQITDTLIEQAGSDGSPVLQNAKRAADIIKSQASTFNKGNADDTNLQSITAILDLACILTENACPHLKKGIEKVKVIKDILPTLLALVNKPGAMADNVGKVMDIVDVLSNTFLDDSNPVKQKLPIVSATVKVVLEEVKKDSSQEVNIPRMIEQVGNTIAECVPKEHRNSGSTLAKLSNNVVMVTKVMSTIIVKADKLREKASVEPEEIIQIGSDIISQILPNKKIGNFLRLTKCIISSINIVDRASSGFFDKTSTDLIENSVEAVKSANQIVVDLNLMTEDTMVDANSKIDIFKEIISNLQRSVMTGQGETIDLATMIHAAIPLYKLVMPQNTEIEMRIESIESIIRLLEQEVRKSVNSQDSTSLVNYSELFDSAGNLLRIVFNAEGINEHLEKAGLVVKVIQELREQAYADDLNQRAYKMAAVIEAVLNLMTAFNPDWKEFSEKVNNTCNVVAKHAVYCVEDPSAEDMVDLAEDLFFLLKNIAPEGEILLIVKLRSIVRAMKRHKKIFSLADDQKRWTEYSEAVSDVAIAIYPEAENYISSVQQVMMHAESFKDSSSSPDLYIELVCSTAEIIQKLGNTKNDDSLNKLTTASISLVREISKAAKDIYSEQDSISGPLQATKKIKNSVFAIVETLGVTEKTKKSMQTAGNIVDLVESMSNLKSSKPSDSMKTMILGSINLVSSLLPTHSKTKELLETSERVVNQVFQEVEKGSTSSLHGLIDMVIRLYGHIGVDPQPEFKRIIRLLQTVAQISKAKEDKTLKFDLVISFLTEEFASSFPESAEIARRLESIAIVFQATIDKAVNNKNGTQALEPQDEDILERVKEEELEKLFDSLAFLVAEVCPHLSEMVNQTKMQVKTLRLLATAMKEKQSDVKLYMQYAGKIITTFKPELSTLVNMTNAQLELLESILSNNHSVMSLTTVVDTACKVVATIDPDMEEAVTRVNKCMIQYQEVIRITQRRQALDSANIEFSSYCSVAANLVGEFSPPHREHLEILSELMYAIETMPMPERRAEGDTQDAIASVTIADYIPAAKSLCQVIKRFYPHKSDAIDKMLTLMETGFTALGAGISSGSQISLGVVISMVERFVKKISGNSKVLSFGIEEVKLTGLLDSWSKIENIVETKSGSASDVLRILQGIINNEQHKKALERGIKLVELFENPERLNNFEILYSVLETSLPEDQRKADRLQAIGSSIKLIDKLSTQEGQLTPFSLLSLGLEVGKVLIALRPQDSGKVRAIMKVLERLNELIDGPTSDEGKGIDLLATCFHAIISLNEAVEDKVEAAKPALALIVNAYRKAEELSNILKKFESGDPIQISDLEDCFKAIFDNTGIEETSKLGNNLKSMFFTLTLILSGRADFDINQEGQTNDLFQYLNVMKTSEGITQIEFKNPVDIENTLKQDN